MKVRDTCWELVDEMSSRSAILKVNFYIGAPVAEHRGKIKIMKWKPHILKINGKKIRIIIHRYSQEKKLLTRP